MAPRSDLVPSLIFAQFTGNSVATTLCRRDVLRGRVEETPKGTDPKGTKIMKKIGFLLAAVLLGQMVAACNTVEGIGKDLKSGGRAIERAGQG